MYRAMLCNIKLHYFSLIYMYVPILIWMFSADVDAAGLPVKHTLSGTRTRRYRSNGNILYVELNGGVSSTPREGVLFSYSIGKKAGII